VLRKLTAAEQPAPPDKVLLWVTGGGPANARMFQHCLSKQTARATADLLSAMSIHANPQDVAVIADVEKNFLGLSFASPVKYGSKL
jgi:hypothetical protein